MKLDKRLFLLAVPALFVLGFINTNVLIEFITVLMLGLLVAAVTHVIRKILAPYVDMGDMAEQSKEKGLVFLGMAIMIAAFSVSVSMLMVGK